MPRLGKPKTPPGGMLPLTAAPWHAMICWGAFPARDASGPRRVFDVPQPLPPSSPAPFFLCIKIRSFYAMGSFLYALGTSLPTPWPGKSNEAPPGQGASCPTGLHDQRRRSVSFRRCPKGEAEETGGEAKLSAQSPRPSGGLLWMWGKRPRRARSISGFLVEN